MDDQKKVNNAYLLFKLGKEIFAAPTDVVINILEMQRITEVPNSSPYMKGVINHRGEVLPVIDAKVKFGMSPIEVKKNTCIVIMDVMSDGETIRVGALVDLVVEVLRIESKELLPVPNVGDKYETDFIKNMVQYKDQFLMVLAVDKVFSNEEIIDLKNHKESIDPALQKDAKPKKKRSKAEV